MKYLILAAIALIGLACSSHSQTIKSLGYDTTNGRVIYGGTNTLTFTNPLQFESGIRAATRTNLGGTTVGNAVFTATNAAAAATAVGLGDTDDVTFNSISASIWNYAGALAIDVETRRLVDNSEVSILEWGNGEVAIGEPLNFNGTDAATNAATTRTNLGATTVGNAVFTATNAAAAATAIGLGWSALTNPQSSLYSGTATQLLGYVAETNPSGSGLTGFNVMAYTNTNTLVIPANLLIAEDAVPAARNARNVTVNGAVTIQYPYSSPTTIYGNNSILATDASTYTNTLATWNSNTVTFATNVSVAGTLAVSNTATFATNVTVNGNLSVGSLTTTTPSTWALDATQTAADTNGILDLPSNANVLRITNGNTISGVSNGVLGAFYFLLNQSGTNVVISNSATITARGATNITLGANESATLISTTATNASAH